MNNRKFAIRAARHAKRIGCSKTEAINRFGNFKSQSLRATFNEEFDRFTPRKGVRNDNQA